MEADGIASTSTDPIAARKPGPKASTSSSDPFANYSTAESLGYVDVEGDKLAAEAEVRQSEGRIGEWQKVVKLPPAPKRDHAHEEEEDKDVKAQEDKGEPPEEVEEVFKKPSYFDREKTRALRDDELYDPSSAGIKLKKRRLTLKEEQELREEEERRLGLQKMKREEQEKKERAFLKSGWNEVELEEEPILMFDEDKPKVEQDGEWEGELEENAGGAGPVPKVEEKEPEVEKKPLFKKRRPNTAART